MKFTIVMLIIYAILIAYWFLHVSTVNYKENIEKEKNKILRNWSN